LPLEILDIVERIEVKGVVVKADVRWSWWGMRVERRRRANSCVDAVNSRFARSI
jgi:hypothetical protein